MERSGSPIIGKFGATPWVSLMSSAHFAVEVDRIDTEADDLDAALVELRLDPRHVAELGGADRGEVLGVREQHAPGVAEPFMEPDVALRGVGLEIRGDIAEVGVPSYSPLLDEGKGRRLAKPDKLT